MLETPRRLSLLLAVALAGLAGGCGEPSRDAPPATTKPATPPGAGPAAFAPTDVVTKEAAYYRTSPAQASPPDGTLAPGTKVRRVEDGGSYAKVETPAGDVVWVATSEIEPLPRRGP